MPKKEAAAEAAEVEKEVTEAEESIAEKEKEKKTEKKKDIKSGKSFSKEDIIEAIKGMTVLELSELVKQLEETFGVSAAPVAVAAATATPAPGGAAVAEEEKHEFDVVLSSAGEKKIQVIKVVRSLTGLGLKEAKSLVDEAPKPVKERIPKEEAEKIKAELEEAGATVELK